MTELIRQRQLDGAAIGAATGAFQPLADRRDRVVGTKGDDQSIDIKFDRVGAGIADRQ